MVDQTFLYCLTTMSPPPATSLSLWEFIQMKFSCCVDLRKLIYSRGGGVVATQWLIRWLIICRINSCKGGQYKSVNIQTVHVYRHFTWRFLFGWSSFVICSCTHFTTEHVSADVNTVTMHYRWPHAAHIWFLPFEALCFAHKICNPHAKPDGRGHNTSLWAFSLELPPSRVKVIWL